MPSLISARKFKGLVPALDRKQVGDAFIADGKNFLIDAEGPYSGFGNIWATYELLKNITNIATFRVGNDIFLFTENSILRYDDTAQKYIPVFVFTTIFSDIAPWTGALVGGKYYFSRSGVNILQYDPTLDTWKEITTDVPTGPVSVTSAAGRLIILASSDVAWSALDNGEDLAISTVTGAGRQSLAIIGGGAPLKVLKTNDGYISYTNAGLMKSEFIDSLNPFRHYPLSITEGSIQSEDIPIDAFNVIEIDTGRHIIVSETGFRITSGSKPQEWDPLFSEFLRRQLFTQFDLTSKEHITSLHYNSARKLLLFSVSDNQVEHLFNKAYVKYIPVDEWGLFNNEHTAFGEFALTVGNTKAFNFGYIDSSGASHKFDEFPQQEIEPPFKNLFYVHSSYSFPARQENGRVAFPSVLNIRALDKSLFPARSGLYDQITKETYGGNFGSVDSFIDVATFRYLDEQHTDRVAFVNLVSIGMTESPTQQMFIDWLQPAVDVFEDWGAGSVETLIDWGSGVFSGVVYSAELLGTLDGYNVFENQQEVLTPIDPAPLVSNTVTRTKFFDAYLSGIYFITRINALNDGESFHLKFMELSGNLGGRIN